MRARAAIVCSLSLAGTAHATFFYYTGFEAPQYAASAAGTVLNGQNDWHSFTTPGSAPYSVHTSAGNSPGFVQNPVGGNQFISAVTGPAQNVSRVQTRIPFDFNVWTVSYDMAARYLGPGPAQPNLGWFQLTHDALVVGRIRDFININNFADPANPAAGWRSRFFVFDAAGSNTPEQSPGPFWESLQYDHWYRQTVTFDLDSCRIMTISIVDLHTGTAAFSEPQGWYLRGGALSTLPLPAAIRFGTGGSTGSAMAWDNLLVIPAPATAIIAAAALHVAARRRR